MSLPDHAISEAEIQAYLDGKLSDSERERVSIAIASDPELMRQVAELRTLADALRSAFDPVLAEPVPPKFIKTVTRSKTKSLSVQRVAAAFAWMVLGGIIGTFITSQTNEPAPIADLRPLANEAAFAHTVYTPEVKHPVEVGADEQEHLTSWLSKRLSRSISAPDIRSFGYQLMGGRLLADAGQPAAQFMYENSQGERLTLYIRSTSQMVDQPTQFEHFTANEIHVIYWFSTDLAFALSGNLTKDQITTIAEAMSQAKKNPKKI